MERKKLKREIEREALARLEDAARTEEDFKAVVKRWDHLDKNRERRERDHEIGRSNEEMLHWDKTSENDEKGKMKDGLDVVIPYPLRHIFWRQLMRGDFIDVIFDCPYEMHELVEDVDISAILKGLSDNHREILYFSAIRLYSNARLAAMRKQTDRNIRKTRVLMLKKIHEKLIPRFVERVQNGEFLTLAQLDFLAEHKALDSGKNK